MDQVGRRRFREEERIEDRVCSSEWERSGVGVGVGL